MRVSVFHFLDNKRSLVELEERPYGECCFSIKIRCCCCCYVYIMYYDRLFIPLQRRQQQQRNNAVTLQGSPSPSTPPPPPTLSSPPSSPSLLSNPNPSTPSLPSQDQNCVCYARQTTVDDPQCTRCKQRIHLLCAEQWFHTNFNIRQCPYCRFTPMFTE